MKYRADMATPVLLTRGSVDGSRNAKHLINAFKKDAKKYVIVYFLFNMVGELM